MKYHNLKFMNIFMLTKAKHHAMPGRRKNKSADVVHLLIFPQEAFDGSLPDRSTYGRTSYNLMNYRKRSAIHLCIMLDHYL